jgi:hypothetical protein
MLVMGPQDGEQDVSQDEISARHGRYAYRRGYRRW